MNDIQDKLNQERSIKNRLEERLMESQKDLNDIQEKLNHERSMKDRLEKRLEKMQLDFIQFR